MKVLTIPNARQRRLIFPIIATCVALLSTLLALRQVDLDQVGQALGDVQGIWLLAAVGSMIASIGLKAIRWYILSGYRFARIALGSYLVSHMIGVLLPARLGDLSRLGLMRVAGAGSVGSLVGATFLEKEADSLVLLVLAGFAAIFWGLPVWFGRSLVVLLIIVVAGTLALALLLWRHTLLMRLLHGRRFLVVRQSLQRGIDHIVLLQQRGYLLHALFLSVLQLIFGLGTNLLLMRAFDLPFLPGAGVFILLALYIGLAVVSPPAGLGIFELVALLVLQGPVISPAVAFSVGLLLHGTVLGTSILLGIAGIVLLNKWGEKWDATA